jgi:Bacteriophage lambda head decoration protein D
MAEHDDNTTHEGRRRQPAAQREPVGALATGSVADAEETRRKQAEANEARAQQISEAEDKAAERRGAMHEAAMKQEDEAFKRNEENYAKSRETMDNRRKEEARRAAMSPAQRVEEDEKIINMTPDERAKYFLETGRTIPLEQEGGIIAPLAGAPTFVVLTEHQHPTEFILSEANGQRSRGNAYLADPVIVYSGSLLKQSAPGTQNAPPTYVLAAAGADADAIALYGGTSVPVDGLRISVLVRDAEVNKHCITWAPLAGAEIDAAIVQLATKGIICR